MQMTIGDSGIDLLRTATNRHVADQLKNRLKPGFTFLVSGPDEAGVQLTIHKEGQDILEDLDSPFPLVVQLSYDSVLYDGGVLNAICRANYAAAKQCIVGIA